MNKAELESYVYCDGFSNLLSLAVGAFRGQSIKPGKIKDYFKEKIAENINNNNNNNNNNSNNNSNSNSNSDYYGKFGTIDVSIILKIFANSPFNHKLNIIPWKRVNGNKVFEIDHDLLLLCKIDLKDLEMIILMCIEHLMVIGTVF